MVGDRLIQLGLINQKQLEYALNEQKKFPTKKLLDILYDLNFISKENFLKILAQELKVKFIPTLDNIHLTKIKIPTNILKQLKAVPIDIKLDKVIIAAENPLDWNLTSYFKRIYPDRELEFVLAHKEDIEKVLKLLENKEKIITLINEVKKELKGENVVGNESAVMRLIKFIIKSSIDHNASDIHIEPDEDGAIIRIRIYGTLFEKWDFDIGVYNALSSRIKLEAGMDVSEKRKPQDGSFSMDIDGNHFDFRVSTLPTVWGESIVIRILDKRNIVKSLDSIGISPQNLELLKSGLKKPNGILLVTGPTGSGKTTTLYASLHEITGIDRKVITVEDPVEYKLHGIQQVEVNPKTGLTFASALKSILRQDPDIIMIGEIRDLETLEIAIKAALTGHLVLSTLHTNDAVSAISRMIDMGAEPYMVAAGLVGVEAQRLVKKNCPHCITKYKPSDAFLEPIKHIIPPNAVFYKGRGCDRCNMTGYIGRTMVSEIFLVDEKLESMIAKNKDKTEINEYLKSKGYKNMFYDGLIKALKGETTLEEVYRVAKL
ncbi:GspE/PulE family protein [Caminibacter mediatlanticus]|uniref:Type ii protein secretion e n=1 Tax=Caminibacter mediatlanticus TB-2 TaxID=391592 RepID=A0AAI9AIT7_9BACT|nr:GspE/PulE family protein [Caminibacter mediatlanticus]EDM24370.1 putative type ii protein secretion e [Caminibacter mediatlanticus TB-2]